MNDLTPGIHTLSVDDYQADRLLDGPTLSAGIAELLVTRSPYHAWAAHPRLGNLAERKDTSATDLGTLAHAMLFEGLDRMAVIDPAQYPTKNGNIPDGWTNPAIRAAREEARAGGKIPILLKDEERAMEIVHAAEEAWERCEGLPMDGEPEQTLVWEEAGVWCRCRPDWLTGNRRIIIDGKFTDTSAEPDAFARQIVRMGYDLRAAFYCRGVKALFGIECQYVFLVQEVYPPFATSFVSLAPDFMAIGAAKAERAINLWRECMKTGDWPSYPNRIHFAEAPGWAKAEWEQKRLYAEYDGSLAEQA